MAESTSISNVTFDDVLKALGDTDPNSTNAAKLRNILGRGGLSTIQKHLDKIRNDRLAASMPTEEVKAPKMPDEFAQLWGLAWGYASSYVRQRLDAVVQERDSQATRIEAAEQDKEAWEAELSVMAAQLTKIEAELMAAKAQLAEHSTIATMAAQAASASALATETNLTGQIKELQHQLELERMKSANSPQAMQTTIDRLTDQIGELKSFIHTQGSKNV